MLFLKNVAIRGTLWTLVGYGGSQVLRLGSNLILTRLLIPELFGLMALVSTFLQGLALFSDIGLNISIVRSPRGDDPNFFNTVWTLQVIRGFGLWLVSCIIAWPVSKFYGERQLLLLLPVVGLTTIMTGFSSTSLATLSRKMEVGKLTRFNFGIQVLTLSVMVVWAYFQRTIWALVAGNLISSFVNMIISHRLDPKISNRFVWDQESVKEIVSFGRWIFVSTAMTFLAMQSDRLILGKLLSLEMLGVYTIALTFAALPTQIIEKVASQVIFPLISQQLELPREILSEKILRKRWKILVIITPFVALLISFGDILIHELYDSRYQEAGWMLQILALGLWPIILERTIGVTLISLGKVSYIGLGQIVKFIYMITFLPLAIVKGGIVYAIIAIALNDVPFYGVVIYGLWKEKIKVVKQDLIATFILGCYLMPPLFVRYILRINLS